MISNLIPERFHAFGNEGGDGNSGSYFLNQNNDKSTLWWYAEHPNLDWANVYRGRLTSSGGVDTWEGMFIDVPKGRFCGSGSGTWEVRSSETNPRSIHKVASPRYGDRVLRQPEPGETVPASSPARQAPGFVGDGLDNISGLWIGNEDRGSYYIREVSGTNKVAWMGENPTAQPWDPEEPGSGQSFTNVMMGTRNGRLIEAEWSDIPRGGINSAGTLGLEIVDADTIRVVTETGRFFNRTFTRIPQFGLRITFTSLTITDQNEHIFEGDEPYFLALIGMMDGSSVNLNNYSASSADFSNSFVLPKIGDQLEVGTHSIMYPSIDIPFKPVEGDPGNHPVIGIALRGGEQDWSDPSWRANKLQNWIEAGGGFLNRSLQRNGRVNFDTDIRRWHNEWTWRDEDDIFGFSATTFTFQELLDIAGSSPATLVFPLQGGDVRYVVRATLSVTGALSSCQP